MNKKTFKVLYFIMLVTLLASSCTKPIKMAKYSGEDISKNASIQRDKETKVISLTIDIADQWKLYYGLSTETIDLSKPILEGVGSGKFAVDVPEKDERLYFMLESAKGTILLAERHLPMSGGYNFRDLGGFKTKENRYAKWGKIFRSDDLDNLTNNDLNYLSSIPIVTIVDFRSKQEISKAPDKNPSSLKKNYELSITAGDITTLEDLTQLSGEEMEKFMMRMNEQLVTDSTAINAYKEMFAMLQAKDMPLLYHCSAGKDRTGMATFLIFSALGVDQQTIIEDYLSSNYYLGDKYTTYTTQHPNLIPLLKVNDKYLKAGIHKIEEQYGSVDNFLTDILQVDIEKMKDIYLY